MKMLRNKQALQKIIIALIILILCNFIFPVYSRANWSWGGTLFDPISDLICGIGDSIINLLQSSFLPNSPEAVAHKKLGDFLVAEQWNKVNDLANKKAQKILEFGPEIDAQEQAEIDKIQEEWENEKKKAEDMSYNNGRGNSWDIGGLIRRWSDQYGWYDEQDIVAIIYSPQAIFSNIVPALDVNFINPDVSYAGGTIQYGVADDNKSIVIESYTPNKDTGVSNSNTAYQLRDTIATWYTALRNIAIVGLLSVLVYIAIRIIMSSTAGETAKYKSMLKDWLVAMCILFFMHYMMAFLLKTTEMITELLSTNANNSSVVDDLKIDLFAAQVRNNVNEFDNDAGKQFGYTLMYCVLIFYTLIFTWKYLKRVVYLAFLTMISPMVALTYPIDKIKDGHAQAFNKWFKEYVFNVLIQPIHLLLYTILITSAQSLAETNLIYSIVALGFMLEAEKIVKSLFGFNSEGGISSAGAAITGGAIFGAVSGLIQKGANKLPGGSSSSKGSSGGSKEGKVRFNDRDKDSDATNNLAAFTGDDASNTPERPEGIDFSKLRKNRPKLNGVEQPGGTDFGNVVNIPKDDLANSKTDPKRTGKYDYEKWNKISDGWNSSMAKTSKKWGDRKEKIKNWKPVAKVITGVDEVRRFGRNIAKTPGGRLIKGVGRVAGRFVNKDNAKKAVRLAAMGVGAATLGTIGLAAGIASDNDGDILKYGGLGVGAGALVGGKAYDTGSAALRGASGVKDSFQQGFYGSEYEDKVLNPRLDKEWKNDKEVKEYYRRKYGDDYKARMEDALKLRKAGITDQKEIDTAIKLMKNNSDLSPEQAANIMQFTSGINRSDVLNAERWIGLRDSAKKMVGGSDEQADKIMRLVNQRFKLDKDLHFKNPSSNATSGNTGTTP